MKLAMDREKDLAMEVARLRSVMRVALEHLEKRPTMDGEPVGESVADTDGEAWEAAELLRKNLPSA